MKIAFASALLAAMLSASIVDNAAAQGSLIPPGAPAPTMKTLAQIEPRIPINSLPGDSSDVFIISQPGSYYLTANIFVPGATNGIRILTNNVVIDLNGFTMFGPSSHTAIHTTGINISGIRIANGQLSGWASGVNFFINGQATNIVLEDLRVACAPGNSFANGISCGDGARISHCSISDANGSSATGIGAGRRCTLEECDILNCNGGITIGSFSTVKECTIRNCSGGEGIQAGSGCIIRNNLVENCQSGMNFNDSCIVSQNTCQNDTGNGFNISGNFNRVEDNLANSNSGYGFISQGSTTNNFIVKNVANGNGAQNYSLNDTDTAGPIVFSSGTITTNSPWANFSF